MSARDQGTGRPTLPPALSEIDRLRVMNVLQAIEIAELRLSRGRRHLAHLMASLRRDGYELDPLTLRYVRVDSPSTPPSTEDAGV